MTIMGASKTIRSLRNALKEIKSIEIENYTLEGEGHVQGVGSTFNEHLTEAQFQLEVILNSLEEKYHKIHKIGAYHD